MLTIDSTGEGSVGGTLRSPTPMQRPLFTSTPGLWPHTGDYIPLNGLSIPIESPSPVKEEPTTVHNEQEVQE